MKARLPSQVRSHNRKVMKRRLRNVLLTTPKLSKTAVTGVKGRPKLIQHQVGLTQAGVNFLKCAFAPPDFTNTQVSGLPDNFRGMSLLKKHVFTTSFSVSSGTDYWILMLPIPGISAFFATTTAGAGVVAGTTYSGVNYPDYTSLFGSTPDVTTQNTTEFRFLSNHFELVSTTNEMTWSGMISAWKVPIKVNLRQGGASTSDLLSIEGLEGLNAPQAMMYSGSSKEGIYIGCYQDADNFDFSRICEKILNLPQTVGTFDFGQLTSTNSIAGFDNNFQSALIKISGLSTTNTFIMRHWACVEYKINPNSVLYEYQSISPPEDMLALRAYREIILGLPIAVPANQNAGFWSRVLSILRTVTGLGSLVPGPVGMISGGLNAITGGITELTL